MELENQPACGEVSSFVWVRAVLIYIWNPQLSMGMLPCQMTCCRGSSLAVDLNKLPARDEALISCYGPEPWSLAVDAVRDAALPGAAAMHGRGGLCDWGNQDGNEHPIRSHGNSYPTLVRCLV